MSDLDDRSQICFAQIYRCVDVTGHASESSLRARQRLRWTFPKATLPDRTGQQMREEPKKGRCQAIVEISLMIGSLYGTRV